jgi:hypothetical protein
LIIMESKISMRPGESARASILPDARAHCLPIGYFASILFRRRSHMRESLRLIPVTLPLASRTKSMLPSSHSKQLL